jgi:hypothetical protein
LKSWGQDPLKDNDFITGLLFPNICITRYY